MTRAISCCSLLLCLAGVVHGAGDLRLQGVQQFQRGEYLAAEKTLRQALTNSDDPTARTFLALSLAATSRCEQARQDLTGAFQKQEGELRLLAGLALVQCHLARNQFDEAAPVVARLKALYPAHSDVLYQAARLHMRAWNDAVYQLYQKDPSSFRVNQISAEILEVQGKYAEAVAEYRKAIQKAPQALNLHFRLGRALLMASHDADALAEARQQFAAELSLNPNDAVAEYQLGQIFAAEQNPAEAARHLERALQLQPQFPEVLIALGKVRADAKQYNEAIALLQQALQLLPRSEAAHYSLMMTYRNAGRMDEARREKATLDALQKPPEGEFTEFLKKLGEKAPQP